MSGRVRRPRRLAILAVLATAAVAAAGSGCAGDGSTAGGSSRRCGDGRLLVYVDSYPLAYFAERIGGDRVEVRFPAPADTDPAFWAPDPETIAEYQEADLVLVTGAGYAQWVQTATLPGSRLVDTSAGLADRLLPLEGAVTHSHGGMGEHSHSGYATTTWLDPQLASAHAEAVHDAVVAARPEHAAAFGEGLASLRGDLDALDARLAAIAGRIGDAPLLFSHPIYQYLARRYGLNGRSLHWDPAEAPGHFAWAMFEEKREDHPAEIMIWEAEPLAETRAELAQRGLRTIVFSPCANRPAEGDYLSVMAENAGRLERAFADS